MQLALLQAKKAGMSGEVPVGAVLVSLDGEVLAEAHNQKEKKIDATAHAEILVIKKASMSQNNWRLTGTTLFVTLEPCPMCLAAMVQARIDRVIFGAYDKKGGALSLGYDLYKDKRLNHSFSVMGGVEQEECASLLSNFFKERRKS